MWLLGSICSAAAAGFYVQVSHQLGSNDPARARNTLRQGIMSVLVVSALIGLVSLVFSVVGHLLGIRFGRAIARRLKPELFGGLILIAIGVRVLIEHTME